MKFDERKLNNEITQTLINGLHYLQNYTQVTHAKDADTLTFLVEGGVHRYRNDALFHAQVEMLHNRVMHVVLENCDDT